MAIVAAVLLVAEAASAQAPPTAEDLSAEARALVQEGKLDLALTRLRTAYSLKQTHDIAGNLGLIEAELGLNIPAAEHLQVAIRTFPPNGKPESRTILEKRLVEVRARLATIDVRVDRAGATVFLDEERIGTTPLERPLLVDPRQHRLSVRLDGYREERVWVAPAAGSETTVDLSLTAVAAAPGETVSAAAPTMKEPGSFDAARPWMVGASAVVLAAGLFVGVTSTVLSNGHASEIEQLKTAIPAGEDCVGGSVPDVCLPIGDQIGRKDATAALATGAFVTAGLGLALGLTFLLVPGDDPSVARATLGPGGASTTLRF